MNPRLRSETWGTRTRISGGAAWVTRIVAAAWILALGSGCALGQYPTAKRVDKKSLNPRAVAVLEWVGDPGKPSASRLIPVSIFIDGALQQGGLYMARPAPMTLESGTVYELQTAGKPTGLFVVGSAGHLERGEFANQWFGYGVWRPLEKPSRPKPVEMAEISGTHGKPETDVDRPTFGRRDGSSTTSAAPSQTPAAPSASTPASGSGGASKPDTVDSNGNASAAGGDSKASAKASGSGASPVGSAPQEDPDRPTLKKRTGNDTSSGPVSTGEEYKPGADPNRPILHRGARPGDEATETAPEKLTGTPLHLQQMVGVSDATAREAHSFVYSWPDAQQEAGLKGQMESLAQAALGGSAAASQTVAGSAKQSGGRTRPVKAQAKPAVAPGLLEEKFSAYELSYDSGAALVLTGHTDGSGTLLKYVAVVAVVDIYGQAQVVLKSVTDAAHLDQTPWMSLVDVVDADDSNRADLLFELHGAKQRQFALYRVARAVAEQVLVTDPMP